MATIFVRCLPDRVANTAPSGGRPIPRDRFIPVQDTPWIRRLIAVHGDIEVQPDDASTASGDASGATDGDAGPVTTPSAPAPKQRAPKA